MSSTAALVFVALLFLATPVAHALLLASGIAMVSLEAIFLYEGILNLYRPTASFPMLAIPFFILAGDLMMSGRFGEYLMTFSRTLVGHMKGGLAQVSVVGSLFFGGVSGSAVADASAMGNALIPTQKKQGYPEGFSAAVNASSSTISVLIPPSIPLILYGLVTETSIPKLFLAGIVPGVMLTVIIFVVCYAISNIRDLPRSPVEEKNRLSLSTLFDRRDALMIVVATGALIWLATTGIISIWLVLLAGVVIAGLHTTFVSRRFAWGKLPADLGKAVPALIMPIMIVILAKGGVVTPTEISVFAVVYALFVGSVIYRDLTSAIVLRCILTAGMMTGVIMLVIMGSSVLQWILSFERVPENLAGFMLETLKSPWAIILAMNVLMIMIGTFLDLPAAVLLLAPIFSTVAAKIGMDPIQLGVMMVVNLAIGLYTPPVGTTLFVSVAIERVPMGAVVKHLLPFYVAALVVLALVSFVPGITTVFL
ncbi:TRAP transporter DctM subunit [Octadecabacter arcticus 238]|uniref:TRAP transporter DctM subunit n=1 Tax=Octadecabacter arcticus 238 TaxID=391616 RepID=M9RPM4_9RHOB|nr:TRAP transporter large permease [Octadecabacter arcticus]AGI74142.1 TRAP transporter DctM subunit [Octadecabacter arcticus 238]